MAKGQGALPSKTEALDDVRVRRPCLRRDRMVDFHLTTTPVDNVGGEWWIGTATERKQMWENRTRP